MRPMELSKKLMLAMAAVVLHLGFSAPANATLIGDTINISSDFGFPVATATDNNVLVGAGVELAQGDGSSHDTQDFLFNPGDSIDIGASIITFTFAADTLPTFSFITNFSSLDWVGQPNVVGLTGVNILDPGNVVLAGAQINNLTSDSFQFQGTVDISTTAPVSFQLELVVDHTPVGGVSEPPVLPLLTLGLLGLLAGVRRKQPA